MFKASLTAVETGVHFQSAVASNWLVSDLLPSDEFCAIYGQSKSGKRAFALQVALHVAAGRNYLGRAVTASTRLLPTTASMLARFRSTPRSMAPTLRR